MNSTEEIVPAWQCCIGLLVGTFLLNTGRYRKAIELLKECLVLLNNKVVIMGELFYLRIYMGLVSSCHMAGDPRQAIEYGEKGLTILRNRNERKEEGRLCGILSDDSWSLGDYVKAKEFLEKELAISIEIGDRQVEGADYANLGTLYRSLGDYVKAIECLEKALAISIDIGNRKYEGAHCRSLGLVYSSQGNNDKTKEFFEKALAISIENGSRDDEKTCLGKLGTVYSSLGNNNKAEECLEKALAICIDIGDRDGEAVNSCNLASVYQSLSDYAKAKYFLEKALAINQETGNRDGETRCYGNLGYVYRFLGDYVKAKEFHEKALAISLEIGSREGEAAHYGNLGAVYELLGNYVKAKEFIEKALAISIEIGDKEKEAAHYDILGLVCQSLGDFVQAQVFLEKALMISKDTGNRKMEGIDCINLGIVYLSIGNYVKAIEVLMKALEICTENGSREGKGACYGNLGSAYRSLGKYILAKEVLEKALAISIEIGDRNREGEQYFELGKVNFSLGYNEIAEEYYKKGLAIVTELGRAQEEGQCHFQLALLYVSMMKFKEAQSCLSSAIDKFEDLRGYLGDHDRYKINLADKNSFPYNLLVSLLCSRKQIKESLLASELCRARALADLMSAQYSVKGLGAANQLTLIDIEEILHNESITRTGLYISFFSKTMSFWIIKSNNNILHQEKDKDAFPLINNCLELSLQDCVESLAFQSYRNMRSLLEGECEDRSLFTFYETDVHRQTQAEENPASCRLAEEDEQEQGEEPARVTLYKMIISPVVDLLEGSEIIICPERSLYQVPFAALIDEDERYLSEKFRIRLIPSLTTLKLIHDSPADYHSQTGALIVGDPDVGISDISRLPGAKEEAEMIGRMLHVQPLIGREATKQAVLQSMRSVSLIHIAAHGDAKRGEIALAPLRPMNRTPQKEDFMLTMSDVSEVQLRAKLVVLSCCHSGRGEIKVEGVVGIARAFLGSGARSVLVSLWAVDDTATKEFMREFYEHLSRGESASECLHEAMKWMRRHPEYCAVRKWAPFVLIGDNVVFNFEGCVPAGATHSNVLTRKRKASEAFEDSGDDEVTRDQRSSST